MSPEDANTHGTPKVAIAHTLTSLIEHADRGVIFIERMRISVPVADISVEPDVVVVLFRSLDQGRVRLVPKANKKAGRFVEIEGPPDIVVECVSDSSVGKDKKKLLKGYDVAGVGEYWLVDARGETSDLTIHRRGRGGFSPVARKAGGWIFSTVLGVSVRLVRLPERSGVVRHRLETRAR
jgi:Uma2 family endonuclease